jgi:hypothetical protein
MKLFELSIPDFNPLQNKNWWLEKYIRVIVRYFNLKWDKLVEFIKEAEKRII